MFRCTRQLFTAFINSLLVVQMAFGSTAGLAVPPTAISSGTSGVIEMIDRAATVTDADGWVCSEKTPGSKSIVQGEEGVVYQVEYRADGTREARGFIASTPVIEFVESAPCGSYKETKTLGLEKLRSIKIFDGNGGVLSFDVAANTPPSQSTKSKLVAFMESFFGVAHADDPLVEMLLEKITLVGKHNLTKYDYERGRVRTLLNSSLNLPGFREAAQTLKTLPSAEIFFGLSLNAKTAILKLQNEQKFLGRGFPVALPMMAQPQLGNALFVSGIKPNANPFDVLSPEDFTRAFVHQVHFYLDSISEHPSHDLQNLSPSKFPREAAAGLILARVRAETKTSSSAAAFSSVASGDMYTPYYQQLIAAFPHLAKFSSDAKLAFLENLVRGLGDSNAKVMRAALATNADASFTRLPADMWNYMRPNWALKEVTLTGARSFSIETLNAYIDRFVRPTLTGIETASLNDVLEVGDSVAVGSTVHYLTEKTITPSATKYSVKDSPTKKIVVSINSSQGEGVKLSEETAAVPPVANPTPTTPPSTSPPATTPPSTSPPVTTPPATTPPTTIPPVTPPSSTLPGTTVPTTGGLPALGLPNTGGTASPAEGAFDPDYCPNGYEAGVERNFQRSGNSYTIFYNNAAKTRRVVGRKGAEIMLEFEEYAPCGAYNEELTLGHELLISIRMKSNKGNWFDGSTVVEQPIKRKTEESLYVQLLTKMFNTATAADQIVEDFLNKASFAATTPKSKPLAKALLRNEMEKAWSASPRFREVITHYMQNYPRIEFVFTPSRTAVAQQMIVEVVGTRTGQTFDVVLKSVAYFDGSRAVVVPLSSGGVFDRFDESLMHELGHVFDYGTDHPASLERSAPSPFLRGVATTLSEWRAEGVFKSIEDAYDYVMQSQYKDYGDLVVAVFPEYGRLTKREKFGFLENLFRGIRIDDPNYLRMALSTNIDPSFLVIPPGTFDFNNRNWDPPASVNVRGARRIDVAKIELYLELFVRRMAADGFEPYADIDRIVKAGDTLVFEGQDLVVSRVTRNAAVGIWSLEFSNRPGQIMTWRSQGALPNGTRAITFTDPAPRRFVLFDANGKYVPDYEAKINQLKASHIPGDTIVFSTGKAYEITGLPTGEGNTTILFPIKWTGADTAPKLLRLPWRNVNEPQSSIDDGQAYLYYTIEGDKVLTDAGVPKVRVHEKLGTPGYGEYVVVDKADGLSLLKKVTTDPSSLTPAVLAQLRDFALATPRFSYMSDSHADQIVYDRTIRFAGDVAKWVLVDWAQSGLNSFEVAVNDPNRHPIVTMLQDISRDTRILMPDTLRNSLKTLRDQLAWEITNVRSAYFGANFTQAKQYALISILHYAGTRDSWALAERIFGENPTFFNNAEVRAKLEERARGDNFNGANPTADSQLLLDKLKTAPGGDNSMTIVVRPGNPVTTNPNEIATNINNNVPTNPTDAINTVITQAPIHVDWSTPTRAPTIGDRMQTRFYEYQAESMLRLAQTVGVSGPTIGQIEDQLRKISASGQAMSTDAAYARAKAVATRENLVTASRNNPGARDAVLGLAVQGGLSAMHTIGALSDGRISVYQVPLFLLDDALPVHSTFNLLTGNANAGDVANLSIWAAGAADYFKMGGDIAQRVGSTRFSTMMFRAEIGTKAFATPAMRASSVLGLILMTSDVAGYVQRSNYEFAGMMRDSIKADIAEATNQAIAAARTNIPPLSRTKDPAAYDAFIDKFVQDKVGRNIAIKEYLAVQTTMQGDALSYATLPSQAFEAMFTQDAYTQAFFDEVGYSKLQRDVVAAIRARTDLTDSEKAKMVGFAFKALQEEIGSPDPDRFKNVMTRVNTVVTEARNAELQTKFLREYFGDQLDAHEEARRQLEEFQVRHEHVLQNGGQLELNGTTYMVSINRFGEPVFTVAGAYNNDIYGPVVPLPQFFSQTRKWSYLDEAAYVNLIKVVGLTRANQLMNDPRMGLYPSAKDFVKAVVDLGEVPRAADPTLLTNIDMPVLPVSGFSSAASLFDRTALMSQYGANFTGVIVVSLVDTRGASYVMRIPAQEIFNDIRYAQLAKINITEAAKRWVSGLSPQQAEQLYSFNLRITGVTGDSRTIYEYIFGAATATDIIGGFANLAAIICQTESCRKITSVVGGANNFVRAVDAFTRDSKNVSSQIGLGLAALSLANQFAHKNPNIAKGIAVVSGLLAINGGLRIMGDATLLPEATYTGLFSGANPFQLSATQFGAISIAGAVAGIAAMFVKDPETQAGLSIVANVATIVTGGPIGWVVGLYGIFRTLFTKSSPKVDIWPKFQNQLAMPHVFDSKVACTAAIEIDAHQGGHLGRCYNMNWNLRLKNIGSTGKCEVQVLFHNSQQKLRTIAEANPNQEVFSRQEGPFNTWGSCASFDRPTDRSSGDQNAFDIRMICPPGYVQTGFCNMTWNRYGDFPMTKGALYCGCSPMMAERETAEILTSHLSYDLIMGIAATDGFIPEGDVRVEHQSRKDFFDSNCKDDNGNIITNSTLGGCFNGREPTLDDARKEVYVREGTRVVKDIVDSPDEGRRKSLQELFGLNVMHYSFNSCAMWAQERCASGKATNENMFSLKHEIGRIMGGTCACLPGNSGLTADILNNDPKRRQTMGYYDAAQIGTALNYVPTPAESSVDSLVSDVPPTLLSLNIKAEHSKKCLETPNDTTAPVQMEQSGCDATVKQLWTFVPMGAPVADSYQIRSNKDYCLEVSPLKTPGTQVSQAGCAGADRKTQLWKLIKIGDKYQIVSRDSGLCLDVKDADLNDHGLIQQFDCKPEGQDNQLWKLTGSENMGDAPFLSAYTFSRSEPATISKMNLPTGPYKLRAKFLLPAGGDQQATEKERNDGETLENLPAAGTYRVILYMTVPDGQGGWVPSGGDPIEKVVTILDTQVGFNPVLSEYAFALNNPPRIQIPIEPSGPYKLRAKVIFQDGRRPLQMIDLLQTNNKVLTHFPEPGRYKVELYTLTFENDGKLKGETVHREVEIVVLPNLEKPILSAYTFAEDDQPIISALMVPTQFEHGLRAKIIKPDGSPLQAAEGRRNNFSQLRSVTGPGTYRVDLYIAVYYEEGKDPVIGPINEQTVTILPAMPPPTLSSYEFDSRHLPTIHIAGRPASDYRLRAKFPGNFHAINAKNNDGYTLERVPAPGEYEVEFYTVLVDALGNDQPVGRMEKRKVVILPLPLPEPELSSYRFRTTQLPTIFVNNSEVPQQRYGLRAKFLLGTPLQGTEQRNNQNGRLEKSPIAPGDYDVELYTNLYQANDELQLSAPNKRLARVTILPSPVGPPTLSAEQFWPNDLPALRHANLPAGKRYSLRMKIVSLDGRVLDHATLDENNEGKRINWIPLKGGQYRAELYTIVYGGAGEQDELSETVTRIITIHSAENPTLSTDRFSAAAAAQIRVGAEPPGKYKLRAKINGQHVGVDTFRNQNSRLINLPGPGDYEIELYTIMLDDGDVLRQQNDPTKYNITISAVEVRPNAPTLSAEQFWPNDLPTLTVNPIPADRPYALRAKFVDKVTGAEVVHGTSASGNSGQRLTRVPPRGGDYRVELYTYLPAVDGKPEMFSDVVPRDVTVYTAQNPKISSRIFKASEAPTITIDAKPPGRYKLRAKINNAHVAEDREDNHGSKLINLPGPGSYEMDLYTIMLDAGGNVVQETFVTKENVTILAEAVALVPPTISATTFWPTDLPTLTVPDATVQGRRYSVRLKIFTPWGPVQAIESEGNNRQRITTVPTDGGEYDAVLYTYAFEDGQMIFSPEVPVRLNILKVTAPNMTGTSFLPPSMPTISTSNVPSVTNGATYCLRAKILQTGQTPEVQGLLRCNVSGTPIDSIPTLPGIYTVALYTLLYNSSGQEIQRSPESYTTLAIQSVAAPYLNGTTYTSSNMPTINAGQVFASPYKLRAKLVSTGAHVAVDSNYNNGTRLLNLPSSGSHEIELYTVLYKLDGVTILQQGSATRVWVTAQSLRTDVYLDPSDTFYRWNPPRIRYDGYLPPGSKLRAKFPNNVQAALDVPDNNGTTLVNLPPSNGTFWVEFYTVINGQAVNMTARWVTINP